MPKNNRSGKNTNKADALSKKFFSKITGYDKDGKGVKKKKITDKELYSLKSFFSVYKDQFWNLIILNLIFMLLMLPAVAGLLSHSTIFHTRASSPSNILFPSLYGTQLASPTIEGANLLGVFGTQISIPLHNDITRTLSWIMLGILLTFGPANVGMTYVLRAYTRRDFVLLWRDFFGAIKRNFFSSILIGALDLLLMVALIFSTRYYYYAPGTDSTLLFLIMMGMSFIYLFMRFYLYILLITFKLKPFKLCKNAFILAFLGIKRNLAALVGMMAFGMLCAVVLMFSTPFGITLPFFFLASNCSFTACFAAWANVKKYMIDPFDERKDGEKFDIKIDEEPVFVDQG